MSSIPSSKMKHAHAHEGDHPEQSHAPTHQPEAQGGTAAPEPTQSGSNAAEPVQGGGQSAQAAPEAGYADPEPGAGAKLAKRAKDLGEEAVDVVKARPKTAAVIGAAIVAGAAALVAGPAVARTLRGEDDKPAAKRKPGAKKPVKTA